jgi:hypothetical protein
MHARRQARSDDDSDYTVGAGMQAENGVGFTECKPNPHETRRLTPLLVAQGKSV